MKIEMNGLCRILHKNQIRSSDLRMKVNNIFFPTVWCCCGFLLGNEFSQGIVHPKSKRANQGFTTYSLSRFFDLKLVVLLSRLQKCHLGR